MFTSLPDQGTTGEHHKAPGKIKQHQGTIDREEAECLSVPTESEVRVHHVEGGRAAEHLPSLHMSSTEDSLLRFMFLSKSFSWPLPWRRGGGGAHPSILISIMMLPGPPAQLRSPTLPPKGVGGGGGDLVQNNVCPLSSDEQLDC